ncbi:MAG TPA: ATP-grasp domain-containing protein [Gemmatimonadales bacterium]|jgi:D-alanine-D-alanine ligase|nr:ATP-grasp domain-containing protein [Gemmatimonadales bacterium]
MKVAILFDAGGDHWDQKDVISVVDNAREIQGCLKARGYETTLVPIQLGEFGWLNRVRRADVVFNLCEGIDGESRYEDYVVGALELANIPYTGCRPWAVAVCHRKHVANTLLSRNGVPIPPFALAQGNKIPNDLNLPAIVKPAAEDASVGIDAGSVCSTKKALRKRLAEMAEQFEEVLVQEYIEGREFNVGFVGKQMLPIAELRFDEMPEGCPAILTYSAKWDVGSAEDMGSQPVCPADLASDVTKRVGQVARQAWEYLTGAEGYGRVDMRLDASGQPYVLEVNPNPDLSDTAGLSRMARVYGWGYDELLGRIVEEAMSRSRSTQAAADALKAGAATV